MSLLELVFLRYYTSMSLGDESEQGVNVNLVQVCHFGDELLFEVRDKDHAYAEFIGKNGVS